MPELPDIEGYRAVLAEYLPGSRVRAVQVLDAGVLRNATPETFRDRLLGHRFGTPQRHGKWLTLPTDGPTLLVHSGMTGRPYFLVEGIDAFPEIAALDRLVIRTDRGELRYSDLRKLRGVWIVGGAAEAAAVTGNQGPDALGIPWGEFRAALQGRQRALKTVLMDQHVIAGLGNMLSDEVCWRGHVHPARKASALDDVELRQVWLAMGRSLRSAVRQGRIPRTGAWLNSARDHDPSYCPSCRTTLCRSRIGGRTSIWCPVCQPAPTAPSTAH
jgi:formamidopyrimidine-DNA glycosylase